MSPEEFATLPATEQIALIEARMREANEAERKMMREDFLALVILNTPSR